MKKNLLFIFLVVTINLTGQNTDFLLSEREIVVGHNMLTDKEITVKEYSFNKFIGDYFYDSDAKNIVFCVFNINQNGKIHNSRGDILNIDLVDDKLLWKNDMSNSNRITQREGNFLLQNAKSSKVWYASTGTLIWNNQYRIGHTFHEQNIGLGIKLSGSNYRNKLYGINLFTGDKTWERKMELKYGINGILPLNDSTIIVSAEGLYSVNLRTGEGWKFEAKSGITDNSKIMMAGFFGGVIGVAAAGGFKKEAGKTRGLVSNICINDSAICALFSDDLIVLTYDGKLKWRNKLPPEMVAGANIFFEDGFLYVLNPGVAHINGREQEYGTPFFAAYNIETGIQKYFYLLNDKSTFVDKVIWGDKLCMLFDDRYVVLQLSDGMLIKEMEIDSKELGALYTTLEYGVYFKEKDSFIHDVRDIYPKSLILVTKNENLVVLNEQFGLSSIEDNDDHFYKVANYKDYLIYYKKDNIYVFDDNYREIVKFEFPRDIILVDDKLIHIHGYGYKTLALDFLE